MKVVHVVAGNLTQGAAKGAYWLHLALRDKGLESIVITDSVIRVDDDSVIYLYNNLISRVFKKVSRLIERLIFPRTDLTLFSSGVFGLKLSNLPEIKEADIVHLHWINNNFINVKHLDHLNKTAIWTFRDMWPFTGGCHYSIGCEKFIHGCNNCPHSKNIIEESLVRHVVNYKVRLSSFDIFPVAISNWLKNEVESSYIWKNSEISVIPNGINFDSFHLVEKLEARKLLDIKTHKKIILFGAINLQDKYKGIDKLFDSLSKIKNKNDYLLCSFGSGSNKIDTLGFEYINFGYVDDNSKLSTIYASADVFVAPSIKEAFGKTVVESLYCKTPVVVFGDTGPSEIVEDRKCGYIAKPYCSIDLMEGILWVTESVRLDDLSESAHERALVYSTSSSADMYISLYQSLLRRSEVTGIK
ncbi:glycosyltransferase [Vibrio sp. M260112]|uniref:glycosyltransferase n=1 Tax=Vibrio sp. M260112 TaxID=3020895 RepID=UPI002F418412